MSELREDYRLATGLVADIEHIIETETDKNAAFRKIAWHMPAGLKYEVGTKYGDKIVEVLKEIANKLGINAAEALTEDGELSPREKAILDNLKSSIDVEIEEPTELPTEAPTQAPTKNTEDTENPVDDVD